MTPHNHPNRDNLKKLPYYASKLWFKISLKIKTLARKYVLKILYSVVFPIISLSGSTTLIQKPHSPTLWIDWTEHNAPELISDKSEKNWILRYIRFIAKPENTWMVFILPFICVLKWLETPTANSDISTTMYTLY